MVASVVAVILNHRTAQEALRAARMVEPQVTHTIIVDNGSGPADELALRAAFRGTAETPWRAGLVLRSSSRSLLLLPSNLGYTGGNNRGHELARELWNPDFVLIMNPDVEVPQNLVARGLALFDDRIGAVGFHGGYYRPPLRHKIKNLGSQTRLFRRPRDIQPASFPRGPLHLIRRAAVESLLKTRAGVFREDLFLYEDEIELGWALRRGGWGILDAAVPGVRHRWGGSVSQVAAPIREYYSTRNAILMSQTLGFFRRWFVRFLRSAWAWAEILLHFARGDRARRAAVWQGLCDGWRGRGGKWRHHPN